MLCHLTLLLNHRSLQSNVKPCDYRNVVIFLHIFYLQFFHFNFFKKKNSDHLMMSFVIALFEVSNEQFFFGIYFRILFDPTVHQRAQTKNV